MPSDLLPRPCLPRQIRPAPTRSTSTPDLSAPRCSSSETSWMAAQKELEAALHQCGTLGVTHWMWAVEADLIRVMIAQQRANEASTG